ncbi:MAG: hypothetical protein ACXWC7_15455 [Chitinophagaceae bacterium]
MQKMNSTSISSGIMQMNGTGKPTMPVHGRQPVMDRKISDPSSTYPKGERYPIPSFFEYRIHQRDNEPL